VREVGKNRGKQVDIFNKNVGNPLGSDWCGAFVAYCLDAVNSEFKVRSGLARHYYTKAEKTYSAGEVLRGKRQVEFGDMVIWARGKTIFGHVAFALNWEGKRGTTIEGNTDKGVAVKNRVIYPYSYFRIIGFAEV